MNKLDLFDTRIMAGGADSPPTPENDNWRLMPASDFRRFLAVAERGMPTPAVPRAAGKTAGQQKIEDLETCVRYTRDLLRRM